MKVCVKKMESSALSDCGVRAVIKFLNMEYITGLEIHHRLSNVYGADNVMSLRYICKGIERFNAVWSNTNDEQRTGCLRNSINNEILLVCALYSGQIGGSQFQTFTEG